jgi:hypothetical protein
MSSNLLSNKTLSNSVIPFSNKIEILDVVTSSSTIVVPGWYYSLTGILVSGGGGGSAGGAGLFSTSYAGGGGGAGAVAVLNLPARAGDVLTITIGAGGIGAYSPGAVSAARYAKEGGSSSIFINGQFLYSVGGGNAAAPTAAGIETSASDGSGGGVNGWLYTNSYTFQMESFGLGTFGYGFLNSTASVLVSSTSYTGHTTAFRFTSYAGGLGSSGERGLQNPWAGGGGGIAKNSPGGTAYSVAATGDLAAVQGGTGGRAGIVKFPRAKDGEILTYYLAGGGGAGSLLGYLNDVEPPDTYEFPPYNWYTLGGYGGSAWDAGTTYYAGGSGGGSTYTASTCSCSPESGQNGPINSGGGGGGAAAGFISMAVPNTPVYTAGLSGGNGGSGIFILLGRRSYPFASKVI